jgi:hypothetical protein
VRIVERVEADAAEPEWGVEHRKVENAEHEVVVTVVERVGLEVEEAAVEEKKEHAKLPEFPSVLLLPKNT